MKGIILTPREVLALQQDRLTQIRRCVKPQPTLFGKTGYVGGYLTLNWIDHERGYQWTPEHMVTKCPHGQAGEQRFVKERHTFMCQFETEIMSVPPVPAWEVQIEYSDGVQGWAETTQKQVLREEGTYSWRSPVLMPQWASRYILTIESVRVGRLQEMTEQDALACGIVKVTKDGTLFKYCFYDRGDHSSTAWVDMQRTALDAYKAACGVKEGYDWEWILEVRRK